MPLLRGGAFIDDDWVTLDAAAEPPAGTPLIVPFARLIAAPDDFAAGRAALGVAFPNDQPVDDLAPLLEAVSLVALHFPSFTDGRAYSQARRLRHEVGFAGELRATGNVLPDQVAFMRQCGFDSFLVDERHPLEVWQRAATQLTVTYQRSYLPQRGFAPVEIDEARHDGTPS